MKEYILKLVRCVFYVFQIVIFISMIGCGALILEGNSLTKMISDVSTVADSVTGIEDKRNVGRYGHARDDDNKSFSPFALNKISDVLFVGIMFAIGVWVIIQKIRRGKD